jgi:hypothetical protein
MVGIRRSNRRSCDSLTIEAGTVSLFSVLTMKAYLISLGYFAGLGVLCVAGLVAVRYWIAFDLNAADERQGQLLAYQEGKIRNLAPDSIETVLVGDSTLGNAIDISAFSEQTGSRSVSLALTGNFGYGGALAQLQVLAKRQSRLGNVILFYSVDAMASGLLPDGYFFSTPVPTLTLPWRHELSLLGTYGKRLLDGLAAKDFLVRALMGKLPSQVWPPSLTEDDYVISRAQISLANTEPYRVPRQPAESSVAFLAEIARLCANNAWNCVYVHGPVLSRSVAASPWANEYISKANLLIETTGLKVKGGPILMDDNERGDTVFHVHFDRRKEFTRKYITILGTSSSRCNSARC